MDSMKLTVHHADETYSVAVTPAAQVAFEREFKTGMGRAFGEGGENKVEHIYWLAHKASQLSGRVVKTFNEWLNDLEGVDLDLEETGPT